MNQRKNVTLPATRGLAAPTAAVDDRRHMTTPECHSLRGTRNSWLPGAGLALALAWLGSCSETSPGNTSGDASGAGHNKTVQAANYPLAYFAQRIAGDRLEVELRAPRDVDPAFWKPTAADIAALQAAGLVLCNGATYSKWRKHVSLPSARVVSTSTKFAGDLIKVEGSETHSHGEEGEHSHAGTAFTTWIDLRQARQQAEAVRDALSRFDAAGKATFDKNAEALLQDLDALDTAIAAAAKAIGKQPLLGSHPVYQYFARRYELDITEVLWEPETVPDDEAMLALAKLRTDHKAAWMIWEGEPAAAAVAKLDAIGVRSVVFAPCGNRPETGDWLSVMRQNVENLQKITP